MIWKKGLICFSLVCLLFTCLPMIAAEAAASSQKNVTLPSFSIQINGQLVDNTHMRYPFFVYKDITYMPLTWELTQSLGLNLVANEGGLTILKGGGQRSGGWIGWKKERFPLDLSGSNNSKRSYIATMPSFGLAINDSYIDNGNEPYPFLVWNDVTYMPLTWKYAHDFLELALLWKKEQVLDIIGGQQQVLERIYYDDAEYLYIYPTIITEKGQGSLKVKKSLDEPPVWMTVEETDTLSKRLQQEQSRLAGETVTLTQKNDGLYYGNMNLLPQEEISVDSNAPGNPHISQLWGVLFPLGSERAFLSVTKVTAFNYGNTISTSYSFLIENGRAKNVTEFPQRPDRIIPNSDGSYWLASNGTSMMRGRIIPGSRKLALVTLQGETRLVNATLGDYDILVPGTTNPGFTNVLDPDGKLLIYIHQISYDPMSPPKRGYYLIDMSFQMKKVDALDPLAAETSFLPTSFSEWPVYRGIDGKLYLIRKNNDLANYTDNTSIMWYDDQLLVSQ
ncbi:hypothetical protein [Paenibacillus radicis (ex Xue et al. 2023)]|uniref:Copper amine oxidase-like N-terminal domain-containing protein n=1 Tax=Paenibacillus radicis (ex Xue et al. 2023) TaxID=2972489 RepID=A0ABT1YAX0_9BACL|nr:hypothetical protein [Paenibacillus radicis (ex Xue et al. 2023)]MCR8630341.1 hypothetical protein [Paenibacillus radicis (ex Xue et al. 2023)]